MSATVPMPTVIADVIPRSTATNVLAVLGGAAFIGLSAQVAIHLPDNPVPITGQTFAVLSSAAALGLKRGVSATVLYAVAGIAGVPWFAGASYGLVGATFGYIIGFILASAVVGAIAQRGGTDSPVKTFLTMLAGTSVIYLVGLPWLKVSLGVTWQAAFSLGVKPFLLGDLTKAGLAAGAFAAAWAIIQRGRERARSGDR